MLVPRGSVWARVGDHDGADDDVDVDVDVEFLFVFLFFLSPSFVTKFNDEVVVLVDTHTETKEHSS